MNSPVSLSLGRIPPQDADLEERVLATILANGQKGMQEVDGLVFTEYFFRDNNRCIWDGLNSLFEKKKIIDVAVLKSELQSMGKLEAAGGTMRLFDVQNKSGPLNHVEAWCKILKHHYEKRKLIEHGEKMINQAFDETISPDTILEEMDQFVSKLSIGGDKPPSPVSSHAKEDISIIEDAIKMRSQLKDGEILITGVPSGIRFLDELSQGFQPGLFYVLAARPSMGKTTCALNFNLAAVESGNPAAFFSLEQMGGDIRRIATALKSRIDATALKKGFCTTDEMARLQQAYNDLDKLYVIDDCFDMALFKRRSRELVRNFGVKAIFLDYLQLMSGKSGVNREQEVSGMSREIVLLAKELMVPIIALAQLNRGVESRGGDKKPFLSDMRESGSIEQDADMVMFLYRAEYYGLTQYDDQTSTIGIGEMIIAKHRGGPVGDARLSWNPKTTGYSDLVNAYDRPLIEPKAEPWDVKKRQAGDFENDEEINPNIPF